MEEPESSRATGHEPCPDCGSSDNLARYDDGHAHCFTPGCGRHESATGSSGQQSRRPRMSHNLIEGEFRALPPRGLTKEACQKFGVRVGKLGSDTVLAMDYRDQDGTIVAQKVRKADKTFVVLGEAAKMGLFGQHLWPAKGKRVVVTEGELDAVALCQAQDLRWPVVSIPSGAGNAKKALAKASVWLESFEEIVLAFDADEAGRQAVSEAAGVFTPGRVKVAEMPVGCKDANEAVLKGLERELLQSVWNARPWRPDGIVRISDIRERILTQPKMGRPYPWGRVTEATFGRQPGQLIGFGAGTGTGKTDVFTQMIDHDTRVLGIRTGVIYMETGVDAIARQLAGKAAGKLFHIPDGSWTDEEFRAALDDLEKLPIFLYDNFGAMDWSTIKSRIRYLVQVEGCEHIYLDHLTALAAVEADERKALETIMAELAGLTKALGIVMHYISHLATPDQGPSHEEGGRVLTRQFKGSRAIGFWSRLLWGLERNQQHEDPSKRLITTMRCLKPDQNARLGGMTFRLRYDLATGLLSETDEVGAGFEDEAKAAAAGF